MSQAEYRKAAIQAVRKLSVDVKIPQTLKDIGVKEEDLDKLADFAIGRHLHWWQPASVHQGARPCAVQDGVQRSLNS